MSQNMLAELGYVKLPERVYNKVPIMMGLDPDFKTVYIFKCGMDKEIAERYCYAISYRPLDFRPDDPNQKRFYHRIRLHVFFKIPGIGLKPGIQGGMNRVYIGGELVAYACRSAANSRLARVVEDAKESTEKVSVEDMKEAAKRARRWVLPMLDGPNPDMPIMEFRYLKNKGQIFNYKARVPIWPGSTREQDKTS